jgi:hypothetical protein
MSVFGSSTAWRRPLRTPTEINESIGARDTPEIAVFGNHCGALVPVRALEEDRRRGLRRT